MSSAAAKDAWYHTKETVLGLLIVAVPVALIWVLIEVIL